MVVEDHDELREALVDLLATAGHEVVIAEHGRVALDLLHGGLAPPDLILLDLMMPVMGGLEFLDRRAADVGIRTIPVIVMTANRDDVDGFDVADQLAKPLDVRRLLSAVSDAIAL